MPLCLLELLGSGLVGGRLGRFERIRDDELRDIVVARDRDALQFSGYRWQS